MPPARAHVRKANGQTVCHQTNSAFRMLCPTAPRSSAWTASSASQLRRQRRRALQRGRAAGRQLLELLLPPPVPREVLLALRTTRRLQPLLSSVAPPCAPVPCAASVPLCDELGPCPLPRHARVALPRPLCLP